MERFFGLMPEEEVEIEKHYYDTDNGYVVIQAGPHGWSIIFPDKSATFRDIDISSLENFNAAYVIAITILGDIEEVK